MKSEMDTINGTINATPEFILRIWVTADGTQKTVTMTSQGEPILPVEMLMVTFYLLRE